MDQPCCINGLVWKLREHGKTDEDESVNEERVEDVVGLGPEFRGKMPG